MDKNIIIPQKDNYYKELAKEMKKIFPAKKTTKKWKLIKKDK